MARTLRGASRPRSPSRRPDLVSVRGTRWIGSLGLLCGLLASFPVPSRAEGTLSALQTDMDQIARRARPAVVTVFAQRTTHRTPGEKRLRTRVGSGVAVEENGILTTASVVLGAERLIIRTANGLQADAELVGVDPIFNIAFLRVPSVRLPALRFGPPRDA